MLQQPLNRRLMFCQTCNARERVIEHGKCIVCGNPPKMRVEATDPPKSTCSRCGGRFVDDPKHPGYPDLHWCDPIDPPRIFTREMVDNATDPPTVDELDEKMYELTTTDTRVDWPWLDRYVFGLCVVATLYVVVQVARWMV